MHSDIPKSISSSQMKNKLGKHMLADGFDFVMDMRKSTGNFIVDRFSGKQYLDMFSMYASASVGYNHPYIKEHAAWLGELSTCKPTISDVYPEELSNFMEVFSRVAIPDELQYVFFVEGGALAVENAMKAAFDWKTKRNFSAGSRTEADICIHFSQAFHGRSGYTLSLTNTADPRKHMLFPKFDWPRIQTPKIKFPMQDENLAQTITAEDRAVQEIMDAISLHKDRVASIIIEPIQAEGGDNHFRKEFLETLRKICDENDILLIFDEVQTGMGITGKMWCFQHYDVIPDLMSFGKKTQVCGFLANKSKLDLVPDNVFKESSRINSTFGGNFLDMMRLMLILEIYEKENLVENAKNTGAYLLSELELLQNKHSDIMQAARGKGLLCAFDMVSEDLRNKVVAKMYEKDIIILGCGTHSIRFRPQMIVGKNEITMLINALDETLNELKK